MKNTPRTLYRYILWELLISFSLSALVLSLLVAIVFAMKALQGGYTLNIVFPWLYDSILYSLYFTVPMAMMVATTLGYGRFVSDGEFFAATASGIAPSVLLRPLLLMTIPLGLFMVFTQDKMLPDLQHRQQNIGRFLVKQLEHLGDGRKGQLALDQQGGLVYWDEIRGGSRLHGVCIKKRLPLGIFSWSAETQGTTPLARPGVRLDVPRTVILAQTAGLSVDDRAEVIHLTLQNVDVKFPVDIESDGRSVNYRIDSIRFDSFTVDFPINENSRRDKDLPTDQLREKRANYLARKERLLEEARLAENDEARKRAELDAAANLRRARMADAEIWRRLALSTSIFTFALVGFPLVLLLRTSQKLVPFFAGMMLVIGVFYPMTFGGMELTRSLGLPAPITVMSGNYVLATLAMILMIKVNRK